MRKVMIRSMREANQNFSQVARTVENNGEVVIFKHNKPRFRVIEITEDEMEFYTNNMEGKNEVKKSNR